MSSSLFLMVFVETPMSKKKLVSHLRDFSATSFGEGDAENSIEFRLDTSNWSRLDWGKWYGTLMELCIYYGLDIVNSCLPNAEHNRSSGDEWAKLSEIDGFTP